MHHRLAGIVLGVVAAGAIPVSTWAQNNPAPQAAAQQESPYKDQGEYDLATAASKEADPQKKLDRLKEWEQKYPDSKLKGARTLLQAQALLQIATSAFGKPGPPELLDAGQKAAQQIVDNLNNYFAAEVKPAQATDQQWSEAKQQFETQAHSVLGWVAMTKRNDKVAEDEFKKVLTVAPNSAQVSYWLGSVIIRQKDVSRYSEALYDFARALSVTGPTAIPAAAAGTYTNYFNNAYSNYHGDQSGIDDLKKQTMASALPPAGFHIKSITEIEKEKFANEEEFNKAHPDIALWRTIRTALQGAQADTYFPTIKGSEIPPPEIKMFKGKVVSVNDKDLVVNVDNASGDATLRFEKALNAKTVEAGIAIEFKGVVESFNKDPYMLTLTISDPKADITGLPATAFGAGTTARPRPPVRRPARKK